MTPGMLGAKPACCVYLLDVNDSEPMVRPWKPPRKPMKRGRPRDVARELDRRFDGFGARLAEEAHHRFAHRRERGQAFRERRHALVPEVARDVQELGGRLLHGAHDFRMRVPGRAHRDAGGEVEEPVAVDVPDLRAPAVRHDERVVARVRRRADGDVARDHGARLRSGQLGLQVNVSGGGFLDGRHR